MKLTSPICSRPSTTTGSSRKSKLPKVPSSYSPCKTTRFYEVEKEENINPIPMINEGDHLPPAAAWMIPRKTPIITKQYIYEPLNYKINNHLVPNNKTRNMNESQTDYRKKLYESEYDDEEDERMILKMRREEIENEMKLLNNQIEELKTKEMNRSNQRLFTETHKKPERRSPYINTMF